MTIDDVALDHEVGAPKRVEDLFPREGAACVSGEKVQERLFERSQVKLVFSSEHSSVENVDLEIADAEPWNKLSGAAVCPPNDGARARDEVVGDERNADVVVRAALEGVEFPAEIAAPGECDHTKRTLASSLVDQLDPGACLGVDVDQK